MDPDVEEFKENADEASAVKRNPGRASPSPAKHVDSHEGDNGDHGTQVSTDELTINLEPVVDPEKPKEHIHVDKSTAATEHNDDESTGIDPEATVNSDQADR